MRRVYLGVWEEIYLRIRCHLFEGLAYLVHEFDVGGALVLAGELFVHLDERLAQAQAVDDVRLEQKGVERLADTGKICQILTPSLALLLPFPLQPQRPPSISRPRA
jgi:hypothetical protein